MRGTLRYDQELSPARGPVFFWPDIVILFTKSAVIVPTIEATLGYAKRLAHFSVRRMCDRFTRWHVDHGLAHWPAPQQRCQADAL